ncbi:pantothenate synthetase [Parapedobacter defluvii]|uniref:Pantothenate synthetase n=1 Tax=Parapedobacter defluvii TaxID=2045106 RepID=A0ABQ1L1I9_9SPHI|nr:pantoate--beta-alanine ligase [Parapedobacter defluvii]GGC17486.1 pantothenate synthetase [Parapedobacter defluvii]
MPNKKLFNLLETARTKTLLHATLQPYRNQGKRIAFVPTMGALHQGHIALIHHARTLADVVVCSIFVNPTQFNDPKDLEKYPRPIETDIRMLQDAACDVLFHPEVAEMYGADESWQLDLGHLDQVLEGMHRPGHFQGVTQIVKKLLDAVQPDVACFGQKDFQQYKVVQYMIDSLRIPVALEMCPTVREPDGLAMSSRNVRLTVLGRQQALALYRTLQQTKAEIGRKSLSTLRKEAIATLRNSPGVQLEYFAIYRADTFEEAHEFTAGQPLVALVAAWVDGVRLIDNVLLQ